MQAELTYREGAGWREAHIGKEKHLVLPRLGD